jgi:hypothetical protein
MKYCAFDLEISDEIKEGEDWTQNPPGISCAAIVSSETINGHLYFNAHDDVNSMSEFMSLKLIGDLEDMSELGYVPLTWNGAGFDFRLLGMKADCVDRCKKLALDSVDMFFHIFCLKGYGPGLDTAAHGMGLPGKTEGVHGDLAPFMWKGDVEKLKEMGAVDLAEMTKEQLREKTLEYVMQDSVTTLQVAEAVDLRGGLHWTSRSGRPMIVNIPGGWLTVRQALELPEPDTSWMSNPRTREYYAGWLNGG